jgi:L-threonylcarbamoyladenylate synthase
MTSIVKTNPGKPSRDSIKLAAEVIREGGLVVFPTETVYGLGANAFSSEACLKIFKAKERPPDNPLIVHISDMGMLMEITEDIHGDLIEKLEKIWPGPVTVLLKKSSKIPDTVTGGSPLVAVRMPDSLLSLELIREAGVPIAAPSANISTRPSITDSRHAIEELAGRVDLILDCGPTPHGVESTIINFTGTTCILLRAGAKPVEELEKIFGPIEVTDFSRGLLESTVPLAPGMKYRHYSPGKKLYLTATAGILQDISQKENLRDEIAIIASDEICSKSRLRCIPLGSETNLDLIARNLFAALRELDKTSCSIGLIQPFSESGKGLAIMNRIRKASSGRLESAESVQDFLH